MPDVLNLHIPPEIDLQGAKLRTYTGGENTIERDARDHGHDMGKPKKASLPTAGTAIPVQDDPRGLHDLRQMEGHTKIQALTRRDVQHMRKGGIDATHILLECSANAQNTDLEESKRAMATRMIPDTCPSPNPARKGKNAVTTKTKGRTRQLQS